MLDFCTDVGFFSSWEEGRKSFFIARRNCGSVQGQVLGAAWYSGKLLAHSRGAGNLWSLGSLRIHSGKSGCLLLIIWWWLAESESESFKSRCNQSTQLCTNWGAASDLPQKSSQTGFSSSSRQKLFMCWELPAHLLPVPRYEISVTSPSQQPLIAQMFWKRNKNQIQKGVCSTRMDITRWEVSCTVSRAVLFALFTFLFSAVKLQAHMERFSTLTFHQWIPVLPTESCLCPQSSAAAQRCPWLKGISGLCLSCVFTGANTWHFFERLFSSSSSYSQTEICACLSLFPAQVMAKDWMSLLNKKLFCIRNQTLLQDAQICNYSFVLGVRILESFADTNLLCDLGKYLNTSWFIFLLLLHKFFSVVSCTIWFVFSV